MQAVIIHSYLEVRIQDRAHISQAVCCFRKSSITTQWTRFRVLKHHSKAKNYWGNEANVKWYQTLIRMTKKTYSASDNFTKTNWSLAFRNFSAVIIKYSFNFLQNNQGWHQAPAKPKTLGARQPQGPIQRIHLLFTAASPHILHHLEACLFILPGPA